MNILVCDSCDRSRSRVMHIVSRRPLNSYTATSPDELRKRFERPIELDLVVCDPSSWDIGKQESEELLRQLVSKMSDRAVFFFTGVRKATLELIRNVIRDQQKQGVRVADVGVSIDTLSAVIDAAIDEFGRPVRNQLIDGSDSQEPLRILQLDATDPEFIGNNCEQHGRVVIILDDEPTARFVAPGLGRAGEYLPGIGWSEYPQVLELSGEGRRRWLQGELSVLAQGACHKVFALAG